MTSTPSDSESGSGSSDPADSAPPDARVPGHEGNPAGTDYSSYPQQPVGTPPGSPPPPPGRPQQYPQPEQPAPGQPQQYPQPEQPAPGRPQQYPQPDQPGFGQPQQYPQPDQPGFGQPQQYPQHGQPPPGQPQQYPQYGQPQQYGAAPYGQAPPHAPPGYGPQAGPGGYAPPPPGYQPYAPGAYGHDVSRFGPIATFGPRLGAWFLDWLLYGLLMALFAVPGIVFIIRAFDDCERLGDGEIQCFGDQFGAGSFFGGLALIFVGVIGIALFYTWQVATRGQTWGRQIVGVKVINERTGEAPGWGKALGRGLFAWFISAQIFYIGYLWMLWDDKKQTLHDKVAGTHVIKV